MPISVRAANEDDLTSIRSIYDYYVLNTVVSFLVQKPPPDYIKARYEATVKRRLPYLVAIDDTTGSEKVVGYAYASPFRGFMLGYGHSVEITIFCDREHTNQGAGGLLMVELLSRLRSTRHVSSEAGHEDKPQDFAIKNVLAVMAIDDQGPKNGLALRDWYLKWGFEEVGRLKNIGVKHGRTLDTMYLELNLE